jgi:hypothetical protein
MADVADLEIEVAVAPPVFGQTRSIEFALGVIFVSETRVTASWLPSALSGLWVRGFSGSAATRLDLTAGSECLPPIEGARVTDRTLLFST